MIATQLRPKASAPPSPSLEFAEFLLRHLLARLDLFFNQTGWFHATDVAAGRFLTDGAREFETILQTALPKHRGMQECPCSTR